MKTELTQDESRQRTAFWEDIQRLPTVESQTVQWFRYLTTFGGRFPMPYSEYFEMRCAAFYVQLHSGYWRHGKQPLWGIRFSNIDLPMEYRESEWLQNYLEILFHSMPHDVLVVENLYEFFPAERRPIVYWPYRDEWCVRFPPGNFDLEQFYPEALHQIPATQYQQLGGRVKLPVWYSPVPSPAPIVVGLLDGTQAQSAASN
jgi:hypothetical protein